MAMSMTEGRDPLKTAADEELEIPKRNTTSKTCPHPIKEIQPIKYEMRDWYSICRMLPSTLFNVHWLY